MDQTLPEFIEHVKSGGTLLLDGTVRTKFQAEYFESLGVESLKFALDVPTTVILDRAINRRVCLECGRTYRLGQRTHCEDHPEMVLQKRGDDEKIAERLYNYLIELPKIEAYYGTLGQNVTHFIGSNNSVKQTQEIFINLLLSHRGVL